jgi:tetratricopeptide (TPR) repeat protein
MSFRRRFDFAIVATLASTLAAAPGLLRAQPVTATAPSASGSATTSASATPSASASSSAAASSAAPSSAVSAASASAPVSPAAPPTKSATPIRKVPGPPDPSADQVAALAELQAEAERYQAAAKDYRSALSRIVRHHYEERKRRVISALDRELDIEKKALLDAREEAIRRLEAFVERYSGPNAHPENTPDAMFRLAALYEERARTNDELTQEQLNERLGQAIRLYKRIVREFPKYREIAGVYYYLGHALNDSSRIEEAQQVWRSLVCHDAYPYPVATDPKNADIDLVKPLKQDHDDKYWAEWEGRHPDPITQDGKKPSGRPGAPARAVTDVSDELAFQNPYPKSCKPVPQRTLPGQDPRYLAEVWWLIGDYHFNEVSTAGGPFNYNRAQSAYSNSLQFKKPPIYGVAMYKLAWTYYRQQRYHTSADQFVELLRYADEQEKLTGDAGTDFRSEAYTYIAGSLLYVDFEGPPADDPFIVRSDILDDTTKTPAEQEQVMRVAIERVQDPKLVPQDQKWTVDIYRALAQEYRDLNQYRNTVELGKLILQKWPLDCGAPVVQNQIAETYDTLARGAREGSEEAEKFAAEALDARTKLAQYVGSGKPWVDACKNDPEAIQTAERLVKNGLRRAAADHTNIARALVEEASKRTEAEEQVPILERALREYKLAAQGWRGYLEQDENASDAYDSRFWLADALYNSVALTVALGRDPEALVADARQAAVDVRDSNENNKYLQPAAFFVVGIAYQRYDYAVKQFKNSGGSQGIESRDEVRFEGEGEARKVVKDELPPVLLDYVLARSEYIGRVPDNLDVQVPVERGASATVPQAKRYEFELAAEYFVYGDFPEAKKRLTPIYNEQCGKTALGYKAWELLQSMANFENNIDESRALAEAAIQRSCAVTEEQKVKEGDFAKTTVSKGYYIDAARAYEKAEKMAPGPERDKAWREAAALYKVALEKAPGRDEAPEAAILGAAAFKQIGEFDLAIGMYDLFIKEYGSEDKLTLLEKGDSKAKPPVVADPKKYADRLKNLKIAYDEFAKAYVLFFNYRSAAETFDVISKTKRFTEADRRDAALNAVVLYANLGDETKMQAARQVLYGLSPSVEQKMRVDYLVAEADLKQWNESGPDEGANRSARQRATAAMETYYQRNRTERAAAPFVVQAAYNASKLHRAGRSSKASEWCSNTTKAFDEYKSAKPSDAMGSLQADYAAECAYNVLDQRIRENFDYETKHHRYEGVIDKVQAEFKKDVEVEAKKWNDELQRVIDNYKSTKWTVTARARQGSLYDSCRTGLYNATPPAVKLYTDKEEKLLAMAEDSDNDELVEKADLIRQTRREAWRSVRERDIQAADKVMIRFYAQAVVLSRGARVRTPATDNALRRLAFFTDILGNDKIREYTSGLVDEYSNPPAPYVYQDNEFLRTRPGMTADLAPSGVTAPQPVAP